MDLGDFVARASRWEVEAAKAFLKAYLTQQPLKDKMDLIGFVAGASNEEVEDTLAFLKDHLTKQPPKVKNNLSSFIANASGREVEEAFKGLKSTHFTQNEFVNSFNPLAQNTGEAFRYYHANPNSYPGNYSYKLNFDDAVNYLASSSLLHSFDGWVYLSNALDALLKGDSSIAIHLAYYAELRSAMSFLATEGVGVFNDIHMSVASNKTFILQDNLKGTHSFAWDAIHEWSVSPSTDSLKLLTIFSVSGKTFDEWAINFHPRVTTVMTNSIIKGWLRKWCFDVKSFMDDKELRGEASYRPQRILERKTSDLRDILQRLIEFWRIVEPAQNTKFELLDKFLLASLLKELHGELVAQHKITDAFEDLIEETFARLGIPNSTALKRILLGVDKHNIIIQSKEKSFSSETGEINPVAIAARATLMLRLTTGRVSALMKNASIQHSDLRFWYECIGIENGFWEKYPVDFSELWEFVNEKIDEITDWLGTNSADLSLAKVNSDISAPIIALTQIHRVGICGLKI